MHSQMCSVFRSRHVLSLITDSAFNMTDLYLDKFFSGIPVLVAGLVVGN
jgi:hypothetical protein